MRLLLGVTVLVLITGCGKNRPRVAWPAQIASPEGFPQETQSTILTTLEELNTRVGKSVVTLQPNNTGSIRIVQVPELLPLNKTNAHDSSFCAEARARNTTDAGAASTKIAGRATLFDEECKIEIAEFVNNEEGGALLEAVLWHELGHCAGLPHDGNTGEIMFRTTVSFRKYQQAALQRFISTLVSAIGL